MEPTRTVSRMLRMPWFGVLHRFVGHRTMPGVRGPGICQSALLRCPQRITLHAQTSLGWFVMEETLIRETRDGLYCKAGDFHVDPWRPVPRAVITHAHADHARSGCQKYLAAAEGRAVLESRLGADAPIETIRYGEALSLNGVHISF